MNYTKQINELKTARIEGDNINQELMQLDNMIHELQIERAAKVLKTSLSLFIILMGVLSIIF